MCFVCSLLDSCHNLQTLQHKEYTKGCSVKQVYLEDGSCVLPVLPNPVSGSFQVWNREYVSLHLVTPSILCNTPYLLCLLYVPHICYVADSCQNMALIRPAKKDSRFLAGGLFLCTFMCSVITETLKDWSFWTMLQKNCKNIVDKKMKNTNILQDLEETSIVCQKLKYFGHIKCQWLG